MKKELVINAVYYHFSQNNSGGYWDYDEDAGITHHVIIEGTDIADIRRRAEDTLVSSGDCSCCGERWSMPWRDDKCDEEPMVYGDRAREYDSDSKWYSESFPKGEVCIHYIDGTKEWIK